MREAKLASREVPGCSAAASLRLLLAVSHRVLGLLAAAVGGEMALREPPC